MTTALGVLGVLAALAALAALVRVHLLPTGYEPMRNAVADYGVGPYSRYYRWLTAATAYAALFVAAALARTVHPVPQLPIFLLFGFAAARLVVPTFRADPARSRRTGTGLVHVVVAGVALATIAWCAVVLPARVDWPNLHGFLVVLGWIVAATAAAAAVALTRALPRLTEPFEGALERMFYAAVLLWLAVVTLHFV